MGRVLSPVRFDTFIHIDGFTNGEQFYYPLQLFLVITNNVFPQIFHFVSVSQNAGFNNHLQH